MGLVFQRRREIKFFSHFYDEADGTGNAVGFGLVWDVVMGYGGSFEVKDEESSRVGVILTIGLLSFGTGYQIYS